MRLLVILTVVLAAPGLAVPPAVMPPSGGGGVTQAQLDAVAATIPQPSTSAPPADMMTAGQLGSSLRYRRADDQAARTSRTVSGVSGAGGLATVTWPAMATVPKLTVTPYTTTSDANPATCLPISGTVSTTGATIRCVVPGSVLNLGVLPADVAKVGVQFDVLALPAS